MSNAHAAICNTLPLCTDGVSQPFWCTVAPDEGEVELTVNTQPGERSHSVKAAIWKPLRRKGKRQAGEDVGVHHLNSRRDMTGQERRGWEAMVVLISVAQMSSWWGLITWAWRRLHGDGGTNALSDRPAGAAQARKRGGERRPGRGALD